MKSRCNNPKIPGYKWYGQRGIKVCDRWLSFENFFADMGERPDGCSIDRIDSDMDYCPQNCRWATPEIQSNNTRRCKFIEANGKRLTVAQWARETGLSENCIHGRLRRGWSPARAVGHG